MLRRILRSAARIVREEQRRHARRPGDAGFGLDRDQSAGREQPAVAAESRGDSARSLVWEIIQTVLLTIAIFLAVRSVVQNFRVEGASMDPTLHTGQYLLINKVLYARADGTLLDECRPRPDAAGHAELHLRRAGARRHHRVPLAGPDRQGLHQAGDRAARRDGAGSSTGRCSSTASRSTSRTSPTGPPTTSNRRSCRRAQYFVLGDNRPNSSDSHLGWFVPANNLIGKAWVSYWPPTDWGVMTAAAYDQ